MAQERGASHEKHREPGQPDIGHCVLPVIARSFAPVGKAGAGIAQFSDQGLQDGHRVIEAKIAPRHQAKSSCVPAEGKEMRGLLLLRLTLTRAV
jgi:hypothetical protein